VRHQDQKKTELPAELTTNLLKGYHAKPAFSAFKQPFNEPIRVRFTNIERQQPVILATNGLTA
jgi:hypothetical protein